MSKDPQPRVVRLDEYEPPTHTIESAMLDLEIGDGMTRVSSRLGVVRNPANPRSDLRLHGQELELESVAIDGRRLGNNEYQIDDEGMTLSDLPERCELEIVTRIHPEQNTALEGLYKSGSMYCTQCEAEGFRKITYYPDRPDVLSPFTTTVTADGERYPVLLSNGNLVEERMLDDGRRRVTWHDPFPKPSYLFALVAGDLAELRDEIVTGSGRRVGIRIYSEPHNIEQCHFAMDVLKRAMRWDEERFGREYDLDVFMVVAVEDFNMGAMENKGLNIFNTACVLASPDTATDSGYQRVESVVAHEYFHNWSGNRVTCRDWFQLSLKEGFTVFRDAEFSSDMRSRSVKRIEDVAQLRTLQFAEDAGPLAHPVRPDSYMEISNFYTHTVYEKGAEVVRMIATLLGRERFRRGSDLYFSRHDGEAVTTEDFVRAMEDATGVDLGQFRLWYSQAGTPVVTATATYADGRLELDFEQFCPPTPEQPEKAPMHIPMAFGLLDAEGGEMLGEAGRANGHDLSLESEARWENPQGDGTLILHLKAPRTRMWVDGLRARPVASLLRDFSAPVRLRIERSDEELGFLALHDSDGFSRWDAMRTLQCAALERARVEPGSSPMLLDLYRRLAAAALAADDDGQEKAMLATMLAVPSEAYLHEQSERIDVEATHVARERLMAEIGGALAGQWRELYRSNHCDGPYRPDPLQSARRSLKNLALSFLVACGTADDRDIETLLREQLEAADNLTDRMAALGEIVSFERFDAATREALLEDFYRRWQSERLVIDRWFMVQATAQAPGALERVQRLERHEAFDRHNPNRVRSLYGAFATYNHIGFHALDGSGYRFLAERIAALDPGNPQLAAALAMPLTRWQRFDERRRALMRGELRGLQAREAISPDLYELVSKSLVEA